MVWWNPLYRRTLTWIGAVAVFLALPTASPAQTSPGAAAPAAHVEAPSSGPRADDLGRADRLRIYLVTMGPGDQVWERFGHNAIRVVDEERGTDVVYNYGMFDFAAADFFPRFLRGDMRYWMEGFDTRLTVRAYAWANRSVYAQELNLTPAQKERLRSFLEWNALEENRYYAYDYYDDNCSTRVRDAIDLAVDGQLREALADKPTGTTYRSHTRRLTHDDLPVYTGLNVAMGAAIDRELTAWEESFLPMKLREHVRSVQVRDARGALVPLVLSEEVLFEADRPAPPSDAPERVLGYLAAGIGLGALFLALGWLAAADRGAGRLGLVLAGSTWSLLTGLIGTVIALLWAATNHTVTYGNENVLQVHPLSLALSVLIPLAVLGGRGVRPALGLAWATAGAAVVGFLIQALPGFDQVNGDIIALTLPSHLGLAVALGLCLRGHTVRTARRARARASLIAAGSGGDDALGTRRD